MTQKLILMDHTIDGILQRKNLVFPSKTAFSTLLKYPIESIDLQFENFMALKKNGMCWLNPIRVELQTIEEAAYLLNTTDLTIFSDFLFTIQDERKLNDVMGFIAEKFPKNAAFSVKYLAKQACNDKIEAICTKLLTCPPQSFIYCDEQSLLDPFKAEEILLKLKERLPCQIEFCPGNENGLATANAVSALRCGVNKIHSIIGGAGFVGAPMEEVLLAAHYFQLADNCENTNELSKDCERILCELDLTVPFDKAIIGTSVFAHESGIHVDGIMKNPSLYEVFRPEEVGLQRKIVIGKHSGKAAIQLKYQELGISLTEEEAITILNQTKLLSQKQKGALSNQQLMTIYHTLFANRFTKGACVGK